METMRSSETLVIIYKRSPNLDDRSAQLFRREKFAS